MGFAASFGLTPCRVLYHWVSTLLVFAYHEESGPRITQRAPALATEWKLRVRTLFPPVFFGKKNGCLQNCKGKNGKKPGFLTFLKNFIEEFFFWEVQIILCTFCARLKKTRFEKKIWQNFFYDCKVPFFFFFWKSELKKSFFWFFRVLNQIGTGKKKKFGCGVAGVSVKLERSLWCFRASAQV